MTSKKSKVRSCIGGRGNEQERGIAAQLNRLASNRAVHTVGPLVKQTRSCQRFKVVLFEIVAINKTYFMNTFKADSCSHFW